LQGKKQGFQVMEPIFAPSCDPQIDIGLAAANYFLLALISHIQIDCSAYLKSK
jgi:hypothetical protein